MTVSESASPVDVSEQPSRRTGSRATVARLLAYLVVSVVVGVIGAIVWVLVVKLPEYTVQSDGRAFTTEEGITQVFGADAWFIGIGVVSGLLLGLLAWRWFRTLGWLAPVLGALAALAAGAVCWKVGSLLGPGPFDERLAQATAGDVVQIPLDIHTPFVFVVWVMMAELPVLIAASLLHDPEDQPHEAPNENQLVEPSDLDAPTTVGSTTSTSSPEPQAVSPVTDTRVPNAEE